MDFKNTFLIQTKTPGYTHPFAHTSVFQNHSPELRQIIQQVKHFQHPKLQLMIAWADRYLQMQKKKKKVCLFTNNEFLILISLFNITWYWLTLTYWLTFTISSLPIIYSARKILQTSLQFVALLENSEWEQSCSTLFLSFP